MKIKFSASFRKKLSHQIQYISQDKPKAARNFKNDLFQEIKKIPHSPYSYRKSIFFENDQIRDLIFKGYIITFRINTTYAVIEVFGFYKYEDPETQFSNKI